MHKVKTLWEDQADAWHEASNNGYDIVRDLVNTPAFLKMLPDISQLEGLDIAFGDAYNSRLIAQRCKAVLHKSKLMTTCCRKAN